MQVRFYWFIPTFLLLAMTWPNVASAIIMRHDIAQESYAVEDADYPALVDLFEPGDCIGTLIAPEYLLTVAHCAVDMSPGAALSIAGQTHTAAEVIAHPDYRGFKDDIALIKLSEPVTTVPPHAIYQATDELGQTLILVGRGVHGTGIEGEPGATQDTQLRRATNVVSNASAKWLEVNFEAPGEDGITDLEGVGASGDSGGPAFIETSDGLVIAGLNSWGEGGAGIRVGQYGAQDYATRVSQYTEWIGSIVTPEGAESGTVKETGDTAQGDADSGSAESGSGKGCGCAVIDGAIPLSGSLAVLGLWATRRRQGH